MITLTREEAQQVLDALENIAADLTKTTWGAYELQKQLIETFRARLAQPDVPEVCFGNTEPVAWFSKRPDNTIAIKISGKPTEGNWEPLYTAPPQREWQGLTKEELAAAIRARGQHDTR